MLYDEWNKHFVIVIAALNLFWILTVSKKALNKKCLNIWNGMAYGINDYASLALHRIFKITLKTEQ
jgi:hypothetical protein